VSIGKPKPLSLSKHWNDLFDRNRFVEFTNAFLVSFRLRVSPSILDFKTLHPIQDRVIVQLDMVVCWGHVKLPFRFH
jgi:hypothetical protein